MKVQIAFQYGDALLVGKAIQIWTSGKGSIRDGSWRTTAFHVELSFDGIVWYGAIAEENVYRKKAMYLNPKAWRVYSLEVTKAEYELMQEAAMLMLGSKYDWLNIIGSDIFDVKLHAKAKYTCDEAVARLLQYTQYGKALGNLQKYTPRHLEEYVKGL